MLTASNQSIYSTPANNKVNNLGRRLQPHLIKRGNVYYFRLAIPKDLRHAFSHRELKRSLKTSNANAARNLASAYEAEAQAIFSTLRAKKLRIVTIDVRHEMKNVIAPPAVQTGPRLSEVITEYIKERKQRWSRRTELEFTSSLDLLLATLGDKHLSQITRSDCVTCRDHLQAGKGRQGEPLKRPRSPKTINQYMGLLNSIFNLSVDQGLIDRNPAERLNIPLTVKAQDQRKAYSLSQLKAVMSQLPTPDSEQPHRYWIPVIALYSGMRLEEVAQLRLDSLVMIDGITCFDIDGEHLKISTSKRLVPVHPKLEELGLLNYVKQTKTVAGNANGKACLFPHLHTDRHGRKGKGIRGVV